MNKNQLQNNEWPEMIDTHAHLNMFDFDVDREETIARSFCKNIFMINVGTNLKSSQKAVDIASTYPAGVFAAVGLHPTNIDYKGFHLFSGTGQKRPENILENGFDALEYKKLAGDPKVIAVGEIGFDHHYMPEKEEDIPYYKSRQKEVFEEQLFFSEELGLPAIIHCRDAHKEMIEILEQKIGAGSKIKGVIHCFNGTWPQAEKYLDLGFFIGVNGIIFKMRLDEALKKIPLGRIVLETDCPFLVPPGAERRNESSFLPDIAQRLADIKGLDLKTVAETTTKNAKKLFHIKV